MILLEVGSQVKTSNRDLLQSVREVRRFVLYSFDAIKRSTPHVYHSALVWLPTSSFIRALYQDQLAMQVKVLNGLDTSWDACIRLIPSGDIHPMTSVVFSHRGHLIAGCSGTLVRILEAATGVCLATLAGHEGGVLSVTFSFDDVFLVSGSEDATVRVWDVQTGGLFAKLEGHTHPVYSVASSPTQAIAASGALDLTVRLWNLSSDGRCYGTLSGHSSFVRSVCWLDTDRFVSGGDDNKVKVWDVKSGQCLKTFDEHSQPVCFVASSPGGSKIASGSDDSTICIHDARISDAMPTISVDYGVRSVCFSLDGETIVYTTDTSVVVWDLAKDLAVFQWQSNCASAAFSPDGSCVAAGTMDG